LPPLPLSMTTNVGGYNADDVDDNVRWGILPGQRKQHSTNDWGKGDDSDGQLTTTTTTTKTMTTTAENKE
jgi:hypothetical protein